MRHLLRLWNSSGGARQRGNCGRRRRLRHGRGSGKSRRRGSALAQPAIYRGRACRTSRGLGRPFPSDRREGHPRTDWTLLSVLGLASRRQPRRHLPGCRCRLVRRVAACAGRRLVRGFAGRCVRRGMRVADRRFEEGTRSLRVRRPLTRERRFPTRCGGGPRCRRGARERVRAGRRRTVALRWLAAHERGLVPCVLRPHIRGRLMRAERPRGWCRVWRNSTGRWLLDRSIVSARRGLRCRRLARRLAAER